MPAFVQLRFEINDRQARRLLNSKSFITTLNNHMITTMGRLGNQLQVKVQNQISGGQTPPVQGLIQRFLKGHSKTLVYRGALTRAIKHRYIKEGRNLLGVEVYVRDHPRARGTSTARLASMLHNGYVWIPTTAQRKYLAAEAQKRGWSPDGGAPKAYYEIPARPFMLKALDNPETINMFGNACLDAIDATIAELKR